MSAGVLLLLAFAAVGVGLVAPERVSACTPNNATCNISANPNPGTAPTATTLSWTSTGCGSASIDQGIGAVACISSTSVSPLTSRTYTLTIGAINACSTGTTCNVAYTVNAGTYQTTFTKNATEAVNLIVTNAISKASGSFVIDHPLDPKNKLLFHSFLESPDAKNIYNGIATLDKNGETVVILPSYFDALNKDVRYQLKPIGTPMPNLFVKEEERDNRFAIGGGVPNGKVSWQITGIRHDPYIIAHPIIPEVEKWPDQIVDKGEYLYPDGYQNSLTSRLASFFSRPLDFVRRLFSW